jgi:hypothetical protein
VFLFFSGLASILHGSMDMKSWISFIIPKHLPFSFLPAIPSLDIFQYLAEVSCFGSSHRSLCFQF